MAIVNLATGPARYRHPLLAPIMTRRFMIDAT